MNDSFLYLLLHLLPSYVLRHQQFILNSATVFTLTVPVPNLNKGGGRRYWSFLSYSVAKLQVTVYLRTNGAKLLH